MTWLIGIFAVIIFGWLMLVSPSFRGFVLVLIAVAGLGVWWFINNEQKKDAMSRRLIKLSEIELSDLRIGGGSDFGWTVVGKIKNLSQRHSLDNVTVKLEARDCPGLELTPECEIIGETTVWALSALHLDKFEALMNTPIFPTCRQHEISCGAMSW